MTFSGIAVEQRSKEAETIKSFLIYSLIGSLALHIGVLSLGIFNLGRRMPEVEDEPIEVTIIDSPTLEIEKPPDEIKQETETSSAKVAENTSNTNETAIIPQPQNQAITPTPFKPPVIEQKQPLKLETAPVQNQEPTTQPQPAAKAPPVQNQESTTQPQPAATSPQVLTSESTSTQQSSPTVNQSSEKLTGLLNGLRNSRATEGSSNNTNAVESNQGSSTGSNTAVNSSTSNRRPRSSGTISTAPSPAKIETPSSNGNSSGSGNGRAACRECGTKYPESARRRGIEGKVEVAVDTDAKGNVTNVRVVNSSGNSALDEETIRQARSWKLKPATGGRQGVSISTEYAIEGSRRHRELQEQRRRQAQERKQRAAQEKKQQAATANTNSAEETPRRRRRATTSTIMDVPPETPRPPRVRQRQSTPAPSAATAKPTESKPRTPQRNVRESLRRVRPKPVTNNSSTQPKPTENRRRRRTEPAPSSSQNKLRNSLRRSQQQSQPSSSDAPASTGNKNE
ncbi:energy transducer TonB [Nostocaceae cyanobacterium CENA357]|uniref:Energy transducer TonB n=1 Tax=Atlanticothrix silvestris CENA357 TaxID=1725252 RepID=A0A8J7H8W6_9CYAN|nr:energy transducer TonB [Atlanticothrix silvestris]MBH8551821.1 energy transducer TonB [Atlanticothrix silvestris CENA357]